MGRFAGKVVASWTLAREYGFTDRDGSRPDWGAHVDRVVARILDRGCIENASERQLLEYRRLAIDLDPGRDEERQRIAAVLGR